MALFEMILKTLVATAFLTSLTAAQDCIYVDAASSCECANAFAQDGISCMLSNLQTVDSAFQDALSKINSNLLSARTSDDGMILDGILALENSMDDYNATLLSYTETYVCPYQPQVDGETRLTAVRDFVEYCFNVTALWSSQLLALDLSACASCPNPLVLSVSSTTYMFEFTVQDGVGSVVITPLDNTILDSALVSTTSSSISALSSTFIGMVIIPGNQLRSCSDNANSFSLDLSNGFSDASSVLATQSSSVSTLNDAYSSTVTDGNNLQIEVNNIDIQTPYNAAVDACCSGLPTSCNDAAVLALQDEIITVSSDVIIQNALYTTNSATPLECASSSTPLQDEVNQFLLEEEAGSCTSVGGFICSVDGACYVPYVGQTLNWLIAITGCNVRGGVLLTSAPTINMLQTCYPGAFPDGDYYLNGGFPAACQGFTISGAGTVLTSGTSIPCLNPQAARYFLCMITLPMM